MALASWLEWCCTLESEYRGPLNSTQSNVGRVSPQGAGRHIAAVRLLFEVCALEAREREPIGRTRIECCS